MSRDNEIFLRAFVVAVLVISVFGAAIKIVTVML
jgi:hypothetical protein